MCALCLLVHGVRSEMLRSNDTRPLRRRSENHKGGVLSRPFLCATNLCIDARIRTQKTTFLALATATSVTLSLEHGLKAP